MAKEILSRGKGPMTKTLISIRRGPLLQITASGGKHFRVATIGKDHLGMRANSSTVGIIGVRGNSRLAIIVSCSSRGMGCKFKLRRAGTRSANTMSAMCTRGVSGDSTFSVKGSLCNGILKLAAVRDANIM